MTVQCEAPVKSIVVGMGEMQVARGAGNVLVCLGLGSCVALCAYDPFTRIGGMAHVVLPHHEERDGAPTPKHADAAVPLLLAEMQKNGASVSRLKFKIAGGAQMSLAPGLNGLFKIGERNVEATRTAVAKVGLSIVAAETGGNKGRTVRMFLESGKVVLTSMGRESKEL